MRLTGTSGAVPFAPAGAEAAVAVAVEGAALPACFGTGLPLGLVTGAGGAATAAATGAEAADSGTFLGRPRAFFAGGPSSLSAVEADESFFFEDGESEYPFWGGSKKVCDGSMKPAWEVEPVCDQEPAPSRASAAWPAFALGFLPRLAPAAAVFALVVGAALESGTDAGGGGLMGVDAVL